MPKPILVGFDPETADRAPVRFGVVAARFTGAPLIVGSAYAAGPIVTRLAGRAMDEELATDAGTALDHLASELRAEGVRLECRALAGRSAPEALHGAAEDLDAGLLVVGSTARGPRGRAVLGSTAERLMHGAPCPVVVVPAAWQQGQGIRTLGVAYTDTPEGNAALDSGLALARRAGAKVRVLAAVKERAFGRESGGRSGVEVTTYDAAGRDTEQVTREIEQEAARRASDVEVEADVSAQDAADFLIAASANVDLLVCGSRGYGPRRAVLLGGVSRKVTAGAHCPVIVLARGVETGLGALIDRAGATA